MTLKLCFYNVYKGAAEEGQLLLLKQFVQETDADILCMSELNGWDEDNQAVFNEFSQATGYQYSHLMIARDNLEDGDTEPSPFHMGLFSKHPLLDVVRHTKGFGHGALSVGVDVGGKKIAIVLTHLESRRADRRMREVGYIVDMIQDLGENVILVGDLNSLSPNDQYNEAEVMRILQERGSQRYGIERLDFSNQQKLLDAGLVDTLKKHHRDSDNSVPTSYRTDHHFIKARVDYCYATTTVASLCTSSEIVKTPITELISDHYPITATFEL